jgi:transcriptional regulator with GAF, ATPase, and Fis domain
MSWILDLVCRPESRAAVCAICADTDDIQRVDAAQADGAGVVVTSNGCAELATVLQVASDDSRILVLQIGDAPVDPWAVLASGAADFLRWRGKADVITSRLTRIREVESIIDSRLVSNLIVGKSPVLRQALRDLVTAARFGTGPILVLGETGTGKELAARVAHGVATANSSGQLVVVDCTTIVPTLMGSELFGHERGAFTGAVAVRTGACSAADGGTLFLDEVGELPHELQPELMRVVQEGTYKRVGGDKWYRSRFRLICATNRDLGAEIDNNRFRRDLYHRIASSTVTMPPLRDRGPDLIPLFKHFYAQARSEQTTVAFDPSVEEAVRRRDYPGNLRDLKQLAYRVAARHVGPGPVTPGDLPPEDRPLRTPSADEESVIDELPSLSDAVRALIERGMTLRELRERVAELAMTAALASSDGNVRAAAARLGVTDRALHLRRARNRAAST